jgi:hypothetical protein
MPRRSQCDGSEPPRLRKAPGRRPGPTRHPRQSSLEAPQILMPLSVAYRSISSRSTPVKSGFWRATRFCSRCSMLLAPTRAGGKVARRARPSAGGGRSRRRR